VRTGQQLPIGYWLAHLVHLGSRLRPIKRRRAMRSHRLFNRRERGCKRADGLRRGSPPCPVQRSLDQTGVFLTSLNAGSPQTFAASSHEPRPGKCAECANRDCNAKTQAQTSASASLLLQHNNHTPGACHDPLVLTDSSRERAVSPLADPVIPVTILAVLLQSPYPNPFLPPPVPSRSDRR
jgi:hypothetical protein